MRWDLTTYFPSFESEERVRFEQALETDAAALLGEASALASLDALTWDGWSRVVARHEELLARLSHLSSFITCLSTGDAEDERYQLAQGRIAMLGSAFDKLAVEMRRGLGAATAHDFSAFVSRPELAAVRFALEQLRKEAKTSMASPLEALASDLGTDGIMGWGRLYDVLAAKLSFEMTFPGGEKKTVPMSQRRSLMGDADRRIRREAFERGNVSWESVSDVAASALNHIAGTRLTLNAKRNIPHFLDVALHQAAISRRTLDAMFEAAEAGRDLARRGLRIKAKAMGVEAVSWFDFEAPLSTPVVAGAAAVDDRVTWEQGVEIVRAAFERSYPSLSRFFDEVIEKKWVDAEPRAKKAPGAYCTHSDLSNEARVFMTFQGSYGDVSTLAHEVGHAFHAHVLRAERVLLRQYPMTLAETASTFAESILADGMLSDPAIDRRRRAVLLSESSPMEARSSSTSRRGSCSRSVSTKNDRPAKSRRRGSRS